MTYIGYRIYIYMTYIGYRIYIYDVYRILQLKINLLNKEVYEVCTLHNLCVPCFNNGKLGCGEARKKIISCSGFRMLCIIKLDASARKFNNLLNFFKI